ncbi:MAG: hypothetical protein ACRELG_24805 [Gemmataceae bacterium]
MLPADEFKNRALAVRDWFASLNPYAEKGSILQLEKVNFPVGHKGDLARLEPPQCFPVSWLKTHGRSLVRYHLQSESKFLNGEDNQRGTLRRRHAFALAFQLIGKEADNIEERESIGDDEDDAIEHPLADHDKSKLRAFVLNTQKRRGISDRDLCKRAKVSHHTIRMLRMGQRISDGSLFKVVLAIDFVRHEIEHCANTGNR